jgi:hypothetical protein
MISPFKAKGGCVAYFEVIEMGKTCRPDVTKPITGSAEVEVISKKEGKRGGPITCKWKVQNQEGKLVAEGINT